MSDLAQAFLERWTEENITAASAEGGESEAERLAEACKADALAEGFTEEELNEACTLSSGEEYNDLLTYMKAAVENAPSADEELSPEDDYGDGDEA